MLVPPSRLWRTCVGSALLPWEQPEEKAVQTSSLTGEEHTVNNIIYLVGLVVVIIAVLSFFGLR